MSKIALITYHGKSCIRCGHTERYINGNRCVACRKASDKKKYNDDPEKYKARHNKWVDENPEKVRLMGAKYYKKNKVNLAKVMKKWASENRPVKNAIAANRRAMKLNQTPSWADLDKIKEIYLNCPEGYHVDHIHPLSKGGLHVDYNLQWLKVYDNLSKGNKIL